MKILIACEYSAKVRDACRERGHDAWSCDFLPTEGDSKWHLQLDVLGVLDYGWDMMIAFPTCTHLAAAGAVYWPEKKKDGRQQEAIDFFLKLYNSEIPLVAVENPVGIISTVFRKPDQIINPFNFGDPYRKKTCLWLKNLPLLEHTDEVTPVASWHSGSSRGGPRKDGSRRQSELPALHSGWKKRSLTFPGIANAMAEQWGAEK